MTTLIQPEISQSHEEESSCCFDFCFPSFIPCMTAFCCMKAPISVKAQERAARWTIKNKSTSSCCQFCCYYWSIQYDNDPDHTYSFFRTRREVLGESQDFFCAFNKVNIWEKETCDALLLTPQGRGINLGNIELVESHLPTGDEGKLNAILQLYGFSEMIYRCLFRPSIVFVVYTGK